MKAGKNLDVFTIVVQSEQDARAILHPTAAENIVRRGLPHELTPLMSRQAFKTLTRRAELSEPESLEAKKAQAMLKDLMASRIRIRRRQKIINSIANFGLRQNGVMLSFPIEFPAESEVKKN